MLLTINAATLNRPDFQGTVDAMLSTNYFRGNTLQIVSTKSAVFVDGEAVLDLPPTTGDTRYFIWIKDTAGKKVAEYVISVPDGWAEANLRDLIGYTDNVQDQDDFERLVESVAGVVVSDEDFIEQVTSVAGVSPADVLAAITAHNADTAAHGNSANDSDGNTIIKAAGQTLSGFRAVVADTSNNAVYADNTIPAHAARLIGVTLNAANTDENVAILPLGEIVEASWAWTPEQPIYLSTEGVLTQALPATGFILIVAIAITATRIFVNVGSPILR